VWPAMRIIGAKGLTLSATQCYSATDVETVLRARYKANALSIDFAGETIPICSPEELRLASVLACAYHNSLVRENMQDASYEPYREETVSEQKWTKVVRNRHRRHTKHERAEMSNEITASGEDTNEDWDEEAQGERVVYDATYEVNEDLVPWRQERCHHWGIERWGLYT